ncbi:hypothetical protein L208DRAFT_1378067 [Tricholoma matsutake]|nr:hypothetical protein L208DRAFT_1378067 [Tricholoma matsutake 945]
MSCYPNVNKGWNLGAHYVPPQSGARIISIKNQSSSLQSVIKAAIREVMGDALFKTSYPSAVTIVDHLCNLLKQSAKDLNLCTLHNRFKQDCKFAEVVSCVVHYSYLIQPPLPKVPYSWLFIFQTFAVAASESGLLLKTKPFQHPCMISTLKEFAFVTLRGASLSEKHAYRFVSSVSQGVQASELELPVAMVCAAANAIHASLDDWSEGHYKKTEFNADLYEDVYKGHEDFLGAIRAKSPAAFHHLMADLYNADSF